MDNNLDLQAKFDWIEDFGSNEVVRIQKNRKFGLINKKGEILLDPQFSWIHSFENGFAQVLLEKDEEDQYGIGLINKKGEILLDPKYDWLSDYEDGFIRTRKDGKMGFLNIQDRILIEPQYDDVEDFYEEIDFAVIEMDGKSGAINKKGEIIVNPEFYSIFDTGSNDVIGIIEMIEEDEKYGLINKKGEILLDPEFDEISEFNKNGIATIEEDGEYGLINEKGEILLDPRYDAISEFNENGIATMEEDGKYGLINEKGESLLDPEFDAIHRFNNGIAIIEGYGQYGLINEYGEILLDPEFDEISEFNENGIAEVRKDGKYGLINEYGEIVVEQQKDPLKIGKQILTGVVAIAKWLRLEQELTHIEVHRQGVYIAISQVENEYLLNEEDIGIAIKEGIETAINYFEKSEAYFRGFMKQLDAFYLDGKDLGKFVLLLLAYARVCKEYEPEEIASKYEEDIDAIIINQLECGHIIEESKEMADEFFEENKELLMNFYPIS